MPLLFGKLAQVRQSGIEYRAWVDMSGGSNDDATLAVAHRDIGGRVVLDYVGSQDGRAPFNPRDAVLKFCRVLRQYDVERVHGDAYAGETFVHDFRAGGVSYIKSEMKSATEVYEAFEPMLNAGEIELLDQPMLQKQLLTLVVRGARVTHLPGDHDDWANAACGACVMAKDAPLPGFRAQRHRQTVADFDYDVFDIAGSIGARKRARANSGCWLGANGQQETSGINEYEPWGS